MSKMYIENTHDIIKNNLFILQHLPTKYSFIYKALKEDKIRYFIYDVLNYIKDKKAIIYKHKYCYHLDTKTLCNLRGKRTTGVTNRYINYLCCLGLLNKQYQNSKNIEHLTLINIMFLLDNERKMAMNVFYIKQYTRLELDRINERAKILFENRITPSNLSNKKLRVAGLNDLANEVYLNNSYKSLKKDIEDFELLKKGMEELYIKKNIFNKFDIYQNVPLSEKRINKLLILFDNEILQLYQYKRPSKLEIEQYNLANSKYIYIKKIRRNKNEKTYKKFEKKFNEMMIKISNNETVIDYYGNEIKFEDGEFFKPCYSPNKKDKIRNQLPKYWYVSNYGRVLSFYYDKPILLELDKGERTAYKISKNKTNGLKEDKNITYYALVGLVFGCRITNKAMDLIKKQGLNALGTNKVECHHIRKYDSSQGLAYNCDVNYIQFVNYDEHDILQSLNDTSNLNDINKINKTKRVFKNEHVNVLIVPEKDKSNCKGEIIEGFELDDDAYYEINKFLNESLKIRIK